MDNRVKFEHTQQLEEPDLMRASGFQRYLDELAREQGDATLTRLSQLTPSLMQDLLRFEQDGHQTELLEVLAACLRHARPLAIYLQHDDVIIPLTVFPLERLAHCPVPMHKFLAQPLAQLVVLRVEPAVLRPPGDEQSAFVAEPHLYHPLGPVAWEFAVRGSREQLLPEIAGLAAYRICAGANLRDIPMAGVVRAALHRLGRRSATIRDLSSWAGFNRGRAMRLLNGLYLQGALIVSRTNPSASNDSWFGAITRF
jgi:hypothetical protein